MLPEHYDPGLEGAEAEDFKFPEPEENAPDVPHETDKADQTKKSEGLAVDKNNPEGIEDSQEDIEATQEALENGQKELGTEVAEVERSQKMVVLAGKLSSLASKSLEFFSDVGKIGKNVKKGEDISRRDFIKFASTSAAVGIAAAKVGSKAVFGEQRVGTKNKELETESNLESLTGIPFEQIAEEHDFTAQLKVDNGDGPYIIHIGQYHRVDKLSEMRQYSGLINDTQESIEGIILATQRSNPDIKSIYVEGWQEDSVINIERARSVEEKFASIQPSKNAWKTLLTVHERLEELIVKSDPKASMANDSLLRHFSRSYLKHFERLQEEFGSTDLKLTEGEQKALKSDFAMASLEADLDQNTFDQSPYGGEYADGGPEKLHIEGKINIQPTESSDELDDAVAAKSKRLFGSQAEMDSHKDVLKKEVFEDREKAVIDIIANGDVLDQEKIALLVYGAGHEFNLEEYNQKHPGKPIGLIELSPKKKIK